MNPINDLINGMDSNRYNAGDPAEQSADIAYLQKLKAMRQARDTGAATDAQVASAYKATTGKDIGGPAPSTLPYQQLRTAREMQDAGVSGGIVSSASGGIAAKPVTSTPSQVAQKTVPWNPYMPAKQQSRLQDRGTQYDFSNMQPGDMRFIDPRTKGFVNTNDVTYAANERADESRQAYLDKVNMRQNPYTVPAPQDINTLKSQEDIAKQRYDAWRAKIDAAPRATVSQPTVPNTRSERQAELSRTTQVAEQGANRKFQGEQNKVAADTKRFEAEKAAEGMIGKTKAAAEGEVAGINLKGEWDVKAAQAKYAAMAPERKAKMLEIGRAHV
jgi:hypothetical protein